MGRGLADAKARQIAAEGWLVLPGLVDLHAHLGEPGHEERESIESGLVAAAAGGFTHVLVMPDTEPPIDNERSEERRVGKELHARRDVAHKKTTKQRIEI